MQVPVQNVNRGTTKAMLADIDPEELTSFEHVPLVAKVKLSTGFIGFRSPYDKEYPQRPYLRLVGQVDTVSGALPYGVTQVKYGKNNQQDLDAIYEFSDQELASLTRKGLYHREFQVPDELQHGDFLLPVDCDVQLTKPDKDVDFPIVFMKINNVQNIKLQAADLDQSLASQFKDFHVAPDVDLGKTPLHVVADNAKTAENELERVDEPEAEAAADLTPAQRNLRLAQLGSDEKMSFQELMNRAAKRQAKQTAKMHKELKKKREAEEAEKDAKAKTEAANKPKEAPNSEFIRQNQVRTTLVRNTEADLKKKGIVQKTAPETPEDLDAINDEKLKKASNKRKAALAEQDKQADNVWELDDENEPDM